VEILEPQKSGHDCGPTALHGALKLYGRKTRYKDIYRWAGTTEAKGTPAAGLKRVLERLEIPFREYTSKSRRVSWDWARRQVQPAVLCFDNDEHWVLMVAGLNHRVVIHDPEKGVQIYARKDFMARWVTAGKVYAIQLQRP
jgi:ABC-type bacteriocin/lantibiotic exporter with double-glycine peptidase domain